MGTKEAYARAAAANSCLPECVICLSRSQGGASSGARFGSHAAPAASTRCERKRTQRAFSPQAAPAPRLVGAARSGQRPFRPPRYCTPPRSKRHNVPLAGTPGDAIPFGSPRFRRETVNRKSRRNNVGRGFLLEKATSETNRSMRPKQFATVHNMDRSISRKPVRISRRSVQRVGPNRRPIPEI